MRPPVAPRRAAVERSSLIRSLHRGIALRATSQPPQFAATIAVRVSN
jgi:hypothetical protein